MGLISYQSFLDSVLIVLVLYKTDLETSESFQSLDACLKDTNVEADIFIYDNSPQRLDLGLGLYSYRIHYIWDVSNPGVSKAYNEGFIFAKKANKKWMLLLDQDTKFSVDFLTKYYDSYSKNPSISLFAPILRLDSGEIYSPCKYNFPKAFILKEISPGITQINKLSLLNSGMLISTTIFQQIGGYDERLKLDLSDFEFIDRYRKTNDSFFIVDATAIHGFSGFQDDLDASFTRFERYCESFAVMFLIHPKFLDKIRLINVAFARAIKLSLKFRFLGFLVTFGRLLNCLFKNKS